MCVRRILIELLAAIASTAALAANECALPPVTPEMEIVLLGAYEAHATSSVALGLQDNEARAGTVVVAPGDRPLAVIIATYRPTIWQFRGAVSRIAWVELTSFETAPNSSSRDDGPPLAGATGVPANRVRFLPLTDCLRYFDNPSSRDKAIAMVTQSLRRAPDVIASSYSLSGFGIPGGEILQAPFGVNDNGLAGQGTVVAIDATRVVASQKVMVFGTLPGDFGLKQLVQRGALVPMKGYREFRVARKIRFPAGLYGAKLAKFWLAKGVPKPDGDPGHSCVMSEQTGKPVFGVCP